MLLCFWLICSGKLLNCWSVSRLAMFCWPPAHGGSTAKLCGRLYGACWLWVLAIECFAGWICFFDFPERLEPGFRLLKVPVPVRFCVKKDAENVSEVSGLLVEFAIWGPVWMLLSEIWPDFGVCAALKMLLWYWRILALSRICCFST